MGCGRGASLVSGRCIGPSDARCRWPSESSCARAANFLMFSFRDRPSRPESGLLYSSRMRSVLVFMASPSGNDAGADVGALGIDADVQIAMPLHRPMGARFLCQPFGLRL